jgi:pimeloyl-ACP methyl ester carboxylesterase
VALDLTGHGQSDWRSADASYQIWDDLPEIVGVLDTLGWDTCDLVGHSRGAIISTIIASAFPERVRHLVLLDAVVPEAVAAEAFPAQMRKALIYY